MFWLFVVAIVVPITMGTCDEKANLTAIKWEHAVNSQVQLDKALESVANAIEADVRMGFIKKGKEDVDVQADVKADLMAPNELTRDKKQIPIMSHTEDSSDLSLEEFLKQIVSHNQKNRTTAKIAKLDFKQTEALKTSVENVLQAKWENIYSKIPVWINADIIEGPGTNKSEPVDATDFFKTATKLENATFSIGWTTPGTIGAENITYTQENVDAMIKAIHESEAQDSHPITFPIRAIIAVNSQDQLKRLMDEVSKKYKKTTFTVWSAVDDKVDSTQLETFIKSFGTDKVYVDVPEVLLEKINLGNGATSLVQFGLFNMIALAIALFFSLH